jgi:hypothetical protein
MENKNIEEERKQRKREYNIARYYKLKKLKEPSNDTINEPTNTDIKTDRTINIIPPINNNHIINNDEKINKIIDEKINFFFKK